MTVFGLNLNIVCKELEIPIQSVKTYRVSKQHSATLYDTDHVNSLLNLPKEFYSNFNAWIEVPGEWPFHYSNISAVDIRGQQIDVPAKVGKAVKKSEDIFTYVLGQYYPNVKSFLGLRIFDFVFTSAKLNNMGLLDFLNKYAVEW